MSNHRRRSTRLNGYDYSQNGTYFITICTHKNATIFGQVNDGVMVLNEIGQIVAEEWIRTGELRLNVELDAFVIMPNHFHGLVALADPRLHTVAPGRSVNESDSLPSGLAVSRTLQAGSLGAIVGQFKGSVTKRVSQLPGVGALAVWQRGYHDRILHSEGALRQLRKYVAANPSRWIEDSFYTDGVRTSSANCESG